MGMSEKTVLSDSERKESKYKEFNFKDFRFLDDSEDADFFVSCLGEVFEIDEVREIKERAIKRSTAKNGDKILELGCGLGHDAEIFGKIVGDKGSVIAIDVSRKMLEKAKDRSTQKNVQYILGDFDELELEDESFDVCYADRVLVSQMDVNKTMNKIFHKLKKGGKICITDCDFGSILFYPHDNEIMPILLQRLKDITRHPIMGRELVAYFQKAGFKDIQIYPEPYIMRSYEKLIKIVDVTRILNDLHHLGKLTLEQVKRQNSAFHEAEEKNQFIYAIMFFTATGIKPD